MPNHCENILTIAGPVETQRVFQESVRDVENDLCFSLERLVPTPPFMMDDDLAERLDQRIGQVKRGPEMLPSWYSWRVNNWGTKWDVWDASWKADDFGLEYRFITAWSPPRPWLHAVAQIFPDLSFAIRYMDEGYCCHGWGVFKGEEWRCEEVPLDFPDNAEDEDAYWPTIGDISVPLSAFSEIEA